MPPSVQEIFRTDPAMIGCSHVSGLEVRPYTRRGPVWRYADQVQFRFASAKLVDSHCFSWPRPVRSVCPYRFLDLPRRRRINADAVRPAPALILDTLGPCT